MTYIDICAVLDVSFLNIEYYYLNKKKLISYIYEIFRVNATFFLNVILDFYMEWYMYTD